MVTVLFDWLNGLAALVESGELIDILLDVPAVLQVRKLPVPRDILLLNDVISCVVVTLRPVQLAAGG